MTHEDSLLTRLPLHPFIQNAKYRRIYSVSVSFTFFGIVSSRNKENNNLFFDAANIIFNLAFNRHREPLKKKV